MSIGSDRVPVHPYSKIKKMETKPPLPPFTLETAKAKVQAAEDAWNTRNPERVALAYTCLLYTSDAADE